MAFAAEEIIALGSAAIRPDAPAGEAARYQPEFEELEAQINRQGSLDGLTVEWSRVVTLATGLLRNKSKDLLVAVYLVHGLFEQEGYAGLAAGLRLLNGFVANFWENGFPKAKPPQARINAIEYLSARLLAKLEPKEGSSKRPPQANEKAAVHDCAAAVIDLSQALEKVSDPPGSGPNLKPLERALKTLRERVGPLAPPASEGSATAPAATGPETGGSASVPAPPTAPRASAGPTGVPTQFVSPAQATEAITAVARYFRAQQNADPRPYLLSRAASFGALLELPRDRLIPGPPPPRRAFFEGLAGSSNWAQLLDEAEDEFSSRPFWFDLQRWTALALRGLGAGYSAAHHATVSMTLALRARLPQVFELSFKEGTPFADGATKAWLDGVAAELGLGGTGDGTTAVSGSDELDIAMQEARKLLADSKPAEAVARLSQEVTHAAGRRARFRAQLALAGLLLDLNRLGLALSILDGLQAEAEQVGLDQWEPALAAELWGRLYEVYRRSRPKPTPEDVAQLAAVLGRLVRVDPRAALGHDPGASA